MSDEKPTAPASSDDNLVSLAPMLGLDALGAAERDSVARRRAKASDTDRAAFDRDVRLTREAMASVSSTTSAAPPPELRDRLLHALRCCTLGHCARARRTPQKVTSRGSLARTGTCGGPERCGFLRAPGRPYADLRPKPRYAIGPM